MRPEHCFRLVLGGLRFARTSTTVQPTSEPILNFVLQTLTIQTRTSFAKFLAPQSKKITSFAILFRGILLGTCSFANCGINTMIQARRFSQGTTACLTTDFYLMTKR